MTSFIWIIITTFFISFIALIVIFTLALKEKLLEKILLFLVSLSTGTLMGGAFLHLLPEAAERFKDFNVSPWTLFAFIFFFFIEKLLHWRHCHKGHCPIHTFGYLNLLGDSIHNFFDGLMIAGSFVLDLKLGLVTALALALHEIPQEIGDFGVLLYAGFEKKRALILNFLVALTAVLGGIFGFYLSLYLQSILKFLIPLAAGGFIYIAASDLLPEIRKETKLLPSLISFGIFLVGILIMYGVKFLRF